MSGPYLHIGSAKNVETFQRHLQERGYAIPCDRALISGGESPPAQSAQLNRTTIGNRFAIHPMEGWDGTADGRPSDLTIRRGQNFGRNGAKFIWGGEAVAVRHDGRANPNQLLINKHTADDLARLRETLIDEHRKKTGSTGGLLVGLQLTHSGDTAAPMRRIVRSRASSIAIRSSTAGWVCRRIIR